MVWDEVCNRVSGKMIRKRAIQNTGHSKREKKVHSGQELVRNACD
jgi:hypothetical protein